MSQVSIMSRRFHVAAGPGTRVSFICVVQYSSDYKALTASLQKWQWCQIPDVKWTKGSSNHVKFPAFEHWLDARLRYLQWVCYWDTNLGPYNLYMTCWIHLGYLVACNLISLQMPNIITEMWPRQNGRHFANLRHFQIQFLQSKCLHFSSNFIPMGPMS